GGDGNDTFNFGAALADGDSINGGAGNDTVTLDGDYYSVGHVINAHTLTSVEVLRVGGGHSYDLALLPGNTAAGPVLTADGSTLLVGDQLVFSTGNTTKGGVAFIGGVGNDAVTIDSAALLRNSTFHGGGGDDIFSIASDFAGSVTLSTGQLTGFANIGAFA